MRARVTIFVTKAKQEEENEWFRENVDPHGDTFTSALGNPANVITHYWTSGLWTRGERETIADHFGQDAIKGRKPHEYRAQKSLLIYNPN